MSFPIVQLFYEIAQQTSSPRVKVIVECQGDGGGLRWWVMMVAVNVMIARLVMVAAVKRRGEKVVD